MRGFVCVSVRVHVHARVRVCKHACAVHVRVCVRVHVHVRVRVCKRACTHFTMRSMKLSGLQCVQASASSIALVDEQSDVQQLALLYAPGSTGLA